MNEIMTPAFWDDVCRTYNADIVVGNGVVDLKSRENGNIIEITEDFYPFEIIDGETAKMNLDFEGYVEYTVSFSTQHCHFSDADDAKDYVTDIMKDEILPVEFYDKSGKRRFGGDIKREELPELSPESLGRIFGYGEEYMYQFVYEIHSWSGKYDKLP